MWFVTVSLVSELYPSAKKYDLLLFFVVSTWCPRAKKYDLLPLFVVWERCPSAEKYDLLQFMVSKWYPAPRSTICFR